jgi:cytochrome c
MSMDAFELNKIAGAVLSALLVIFGSKTVLDIVYREHKPEKPGWALPITEPQTTSTATPQVAFDPASVVTLLGKANADAGQDVFKRCLQCHTPDKGGRNLVGPNLWGVIGRARASEAGFNYSAAMKAKGGTWTIDDLNQFMINPRGAVPGTNMTFAGINRGGERADLIAYLNTLSDNPAPLPKAAQAPGAPKAQ